MLHSAFCEAVDEKTHTLVTRPSFLVFVCVCVWGVPQAVAACAVRADKLMRFFMLHV